MPTKYERLRDAVIDEVDDFSEADVVSEYGKKYSARTRLTTLGIGNFLRGFMVKGLNKRMRHLFGNEWRRVGPLDMESVTTLGALIELCCRRSQTAIPSDEPK